MPPDQQAARVNVSDADWIAFRTLALRRHRSIADYLGVLVRRELATAERKAHALPAEEPEPEPRRTPTPARVAGRDLLTSLPRPRPRPPAWEE